MHRWWFSKKQRTIQEKYDIIRDGSSHTRQVLVDGVWRDYSEWTTSPNGKCNWSDAILVAESDKELPVMINGVLQS